MPGVLSKSLFLGLAFFGFASVASASDQFAVIYNNAKNDGGFNESAFTGVTKVKAEAEMQGLSPAIAEPVWRTLIDRCIAYEFESFDNLKPGLDNSFFSVDKFASEYTL